MGVKPFLKQIRSEKTVELFRYPYCLNLLNIIAYRASRNGDGLERRPGEALIGDYENYGMTERVYRTTKKRLTKWHLATFRTTNKGTIATLNDSSIYDINIKTNNEQPDADSDEQETTINKGKKTNEERNKELAFLLLQKIRERKPDFKEPNLNQWTKHIDLMIRIDNRKPEIIEKVIIWCQADCGDGGKWKGWQNNILSTEKLRKQFDKLELAMNKSKPQATLKSKICFACKAPATIKIQTGRGKRLICNECNDFLDKAPLFENFKQQTIPKTKLEISQIIEIISKQKTRRLR
jgi:hypothetical protein